jgi:hypothetical protein
MRGVLLWLSRKSSGYVFAPACHPRKTANTTGIKRTFRWTPEMREAVEAVKAARSVHIAPYLFCTRKGEGYFERVYRRKPEIVKPLR